MFVFAHLFPDISIKSTKLHFQSRKKFSPMISVFFCEMTAEEKTVPNGMRTENSLDIFYISQSYLGQSLPDFMSVYLDFKSTGMHGKSRDPSAIKYDCFKSDDSRNCIIRKTWLHCI